MHARISTVAFLGIDIVDVDVQVHLGGGVGAFLHVGLPDKTIAESRERVRAALDGIHRARIQTIHAFCGSLLRERPVEAALDPQFVQLDEMQASAEFDRAFREWFDRVLENPPEGLVVAMERGLGASKVRALAEMMQMHRAVLPMAMPAVPMPDIDEFVDVLLINASELRTLLDGCDPDDPGADDIRKIITLADQVDILWVIDNSTSMINEQEAVALGAEDFISNLRKSGVIQ